MTMEDKLAVILNSPNLHQQIAALIRQNLKDHELEKEDIEDLTKLFIQKINAIPTVKSGVTNTSGSSK